MREFDDPKYPEGIDAEFNEKERALEEARETIRVWEKQRSREEALRDQDAQAESIQEEGIDAEEAYNREMDSRLARECERQWEEYKTLYEVWCEECGRVSVWHKEPNAEGQRNWHELQHLEGVMGTRTVVRVFVICQ